MTKRLETRHRRAAARVGALLATSAALLVMGLGALVAPSVAAARPVAAAAVPPDGVSHAQPPADDNTLTWSVRPTPTPEQPERPNFSFDVEANGVIRDSIRVRNFGTEPLPLNIYASDALTTQSGALDLLPAGEVPEDVGAWITLETNSIDVAPGQFVDVPFTMAVPLNAESGDHTGGIVTSFRSESEDDSGQPVILDRRLGNRVYVRVSGPLHPSLTISNLDTSYSGTANPIGKGSMDVSYTVTNTGNVRLGADQLINVDGLLGLTGRQLNLERMPELLPGNSLNFTLEVDDVWPTFRTETEVKLTAVPIRPGDVFENLVQTSATKSVWTMPWPQGIVLALIVGGPALWWLAHRRRGRREDARVQAAVEAALAKQSANGSAANGSAPEPDRAAVPDTADETEPTAAEKTGDPARGNLS